MKLYLLWRREHVGYDEYDSMLIRAIDATTAREMANKHDPSHQIWHLSKRVACRIVHKKGYKGVLISSFNAG